MMLQRILITGGAGFIGSHTVDLLLQQGKQVIVLDNLFSGKLENLNLKHPDLEFIEGDVLEYPLVEELVENCDAVIHLAAISSVPHSIEEPLYSFQVNTQGFLHVLQAVHKSHRLIRLIYASSAAVYGEIDKLPCDDDKPLQSKPLSACALQKRHAEQYADLYNHLYGIKSLALRYFNIYGDRQNPQDASVIIQFLEAYKKDEDLIIYGDGKQSRDFIHVSDIAKANHLAIESNYNGVLNIGTGTPHTLLQIIDEIKFAGQKPAKLQFTDSRPSDITASYAATKKATKHLNFTSSISIQEGIKALYDKHQGGELNYYENEQ